MTAPVKVRVREEDYLAMMTDEKPSLEFVNGEVFQKPLQKKPHQDVGRVIARRLFAYEERHGGYLGWEVTTNFSHAEDRRYRVPDIAYWAPDRPLAQENEVFLPPTLAVEVRSRGQTMDELREKCREYRSRGVDVCWLIDPDSRTSEVFDEGHDGEPIGEDGTLASTAMPGFELSLQDLWQALES